MPDKPFLASWEFAAGVATTLGVLGLVVVVWG